MYVHELGFSTDVLSELRTSEEGKVSYRTTSMCTCSPSQKGLQISARPTVPAVRLTRNQLAVHQVAAVPEIFAVEAQPYQLPFPPVFCTEAEFINIQFQSSQT